MMMTVVVVVVVVVVEGDSRTRLTDLRGVQNNDGTQEVQWTPHFVCPHLRLSVTATYLG